MKKINGKVCIAILLILSVLVSGAISIDQVVGPEGHIHDDDIPDPGP